MYFLIYIIKNESPNELTSNPVVLKIENDFLVVSMGYQFSAIVKFHYSFAMFRVTWRIEVSKNASQQRLQEGDKTKRKQNF